MPLRPHANFPHSSAADRRDNQFIYLEAVTPAAQLSLIVPAATVKPTIPPAVLNPIAHLHNREGGLGKPYFEALVPWEVNHAVQIYKDRKEMLLQDEFVGKKKELDAHAARFVQLHCTIWKRLDG